VIILTSNIGTAVASEIENREDLSLEDRHELARHAVLEEVKKHFRPELINRLDEQVVFHRLEREHMRGIVQIQLRLFLERLAGRGLAAQVSDAAMDVLVEAGWDPAFGARPLKRALQRLMENPMAQKILGGEYAGGDSIDIDAVGGELTFERRT
jgi:ATP-dependent Clp protease ATP-binding subunit ClpB